MPHLLFYGPPGTGKTSTILACARQLYTPPEFTSMVLEVSLLNSFLDRAFCFYFLLFLFFYFGLARFKVILRKGRTGF